MKARKTTFLLPLIVFILSSKPSSALWMLNFATARNAPKGSVELGGGLGSQLDYLNLIPHAGLRWGFAKQLDVGIRFSQTPVSLPVWGVGPGFGLNMDVKYCFTQPESIFDYGITVGVGSIPYSTGKKNVFSYGLNASLMGTFNISNTKAFTWNLRYMHLNFPRERKTINIKYFDFAGLTLGFKMEVNKTVSLFPEIGFYLFEEPTPGADYIYPGCQFGIMIVKRV